MPRSSAAFAYDTPRCLISRTASSLNSRVNCLLSMTHLLLHKTPNSVSSEPGAAHSVAEASKIAFKKHVGRHQDFSTLSSIEWDHFDVPFERAKELLDSLLDWRA